MKIEIRNIHKKFGKVHANNDISLTVHEGEILGVLGENGAGKTTLMKILAGLQPPDSGEIWIDGSEKRFSSANDALANGIGMLSQDPLDVPRLSIFDNLYLGQGSGIFIKKKEFRKKVTALQSSLNFHFDLDNFVDDCSMGERQQLEILRLLLHGTDLIILDEPTTGISASHKKQLFHLLKELSQAGKSVIFVTHKLAEVNDLCTRTIVLRQGRLVGEREMPCASGDLVELMFGKPLHLENGKDVTGSTCNVHVNKLVIKDPKFLSNAVDLDIMQGEIIGLAGMEGSGQKSFLHTLAGVRRVQSGEIWKEDIALHRKATHRFAEEGIYFIPAARIEEGLVRGMRMNEHFALMQEPKTALVDFEKANRLAEAKIEEYNIRGFPTSNVEELSGGNQQRLLLALIKENSSLLLLENPSRGLDIESTNWIWKKIHARCAAGCSVVFASADIDELLLYSNRILVFFGGKISRCYSRDEMNSAKLGAMIGGEDWS